MNERKKLTARLAVLLLALAALAVWFVVGQGGRSESEGTLSVSVTAPGSVAPGGTVTYTITVTNNGSTPQTAVVHDTLLTGSPASIVEATSAHGACDHTGTTVDCVLRTISPGGTATIIVKKVATLRVGGILEFVDPSELRAASAESAPSSSGLPLAETAGGAAAAAAVVAAGLGIGGWYVRRRLS